MLRPARPDRKSRISLHEPIVIESMAKKKPTALDVFQHTPKTNCGECGLETCMAFSLQVAQGEKPPQDCPYIDAATADELASAIPEPIDVPDPRASLLAELKREIVNVDFADAAERLGGELHGDRLAIRCLGKLFEVNPEGGLHSDAHIHDWVHLPILQYVVHGEGKDPTGVWKNFNQLEGFRDRSLFFTHRCEKAFQEMADEHPDLFFDILDLFGEDFPPEDPTADRAVILYPLPKVPIVFCYWAPEDEFESKLTLLFDKATEVNLGGEGTYLLVQGIVEMFRKIIWRHVAASVAGTR